MLRKVVIDVLIFNSVLVHCEGERGDVEVLHEINEKK